MVKEVIGVGYTVFFERLKKFDEMRLITLTQAKIRGNTREIALRYDADRVVGLWSRKINSIFISSLADAIGLVPLSYQPSIAPLADIHLFFLTTVDCCTINQACCRDFRKVLSSRE